MPRRKIIISLQLVFVLLLVSWLILFCISPVVFFPDSESYQATTAHLTDSTSIRPILFPLLLRITDALHLKLSIVCFLIDIFSLVCFLRLAGPRRKLLSPTNLGLLIGFLLLPGIWNYCGTCLTESILPAVEIWIIILLVGLFFPGRELSLPSAILRSVAIAMLAALLKPWLMLYVLGSSALLIAVSWCTDLFRSVRKSAIVLFIVSAGSFLCSYRYNVSKSPSSANIGFLLASSGKAEDLKLRWRSEKDTTTEEARFIRSLIDDLDLINNKYNGDPYDPPVKDLKVLRVTERDYVDTVNKAFRISYLERTKDMVALMRLSLHKYIREIHLGLDCLNKLYGPSLPLLPIAGVYSVILLSVVAFIYWFVRRRRANASSSSNQLTPIGKKRLIFVGLLLASSLVFALFLCVSGGVELPRTVLPAVFFQLLTLTWLIANKHDLLYKI